MNKYIQGKQEDFVKVMDFFKKDISSLRTGRANPAMLDGIQVEAYGTRTLLAGVASINVPDARSLVITAWDKNVTKDIEKALVVANLGLNIVNEGDKIRAMISPLTEENRRGLVKRLNEKMEEARISLRQVRDEIKEEIEEVFKTVEQKLLWWYEIPDTQKELPNWMIPIIKTVDYVLTRLANISPRVCENLWCYWVGGFREVVYTGIKL